MGVERKGRTLESDKTPGCENLTSTTLAALLGLFASIATTLGFYELLIRWLR